MLQLSCNIGETTQNHYQTYLELIMSFISMTTYVNMAICNTIRDNAMFQLFYVGFFYSLINWWSYHVNKNDGWKDKWVDSQMEKVKLICPTFNFDEQRIR